MNITTVMRTWLAAAPDSSAADELRQGKAPWAVHLLWSTWIFITPLLDTQGYTLSWFLFTLGTYPIFIAVYLKAHYASCRHMHFYGFAVGSLCLLTLPWYSSGLSYFFFACTMFMKWRASFRARVGLLLLINALYIALAWRAGYPWAMLISMPTMAFIICAVIVVEIKSRERDAALRLSQEEVRRLAATAERERIGRDLHDLLGHTLSLITLKLELSRKLFDRDSAAARRELEEAERVARHALAEVRAAVTGIRSTDLAAELASARLLLESSAVHLDYGVLPDSLPQDVERMLALVIREAMTNIHRHADATEACVRFTRAADRLDMQINDNGKGGLVAHGNGMSGMCERICAIGGSLQVDSPPRRGTRLLISVPLQMQKGQVLSETISQDNLAGRAA
ncbi:sensor histidine kinase [Dyella nitratireducens]|uniref:Two-component sensor histidine kinase n=1 Tax=Dyella nitratireducens TaxID=1849580 RepID=A0ABQ1G0R4_9GAMM|nr:sensor histidine kinase [Dyella nitratireducens]GGA35236.1 two-component sensor histidine kinase [Dyella nitratireducens]GLQ40972.1 two-component sensor histidine kinase [Dyella nitratireducens]